MREIVEEPLASDEKRLLIDALNNGKSQTSFELGPDVQRDGHAHSRGASDSPLYLENGKRVVKEVTGNPRHETI